MRAWVLLSLLAAALPAGATLLRGSVVPPPAGVVVVDTRPIEACLRLSVAQARCLPAGEFLDARGRLAPWREIVWVITTARLSGRESVIVIGDHAPDRHLVAGLLEIAGQRRVTVTEAAVAELLSAGWPRGTGVPRDFARQLAYTAPMRERLLILPHEPRPPGTVSGATARETLHEWVRLRLAGRDVPILLGGNP